MVESHTVVILFIRSTNLLIERESGFSMFQLADLYRIGSAGKQTAVDFCCVSPSRFLSCFSRGGRWIVVLRDSVE